MAHTKSAIKRLRTSKQANLRNRMRLSELKTLEKKLRAAVDAKDAAVAAELGKTYCSRIDKAAKVGTVHANRAANKKSQVDKLLNSLAN
ncbi:30S ribosomal protein S20 [Victivallis vadensis]|jgi:ribosomal protein S20|uniref:Small ribosomal subunit protein bS20 n=1 Tax=Victivallis vadensis TaxID=172901 RepID=A0A2U1BBD4_9BACT|nr:30S ribosomal protein S20 [Victivallis vadensis]NMD87623.1 30S ribosomal protein S20 [Victivallis vadensis]PVY45963.1 small subunit ribosomal protein S20 [Victivallis vadensis]PWM75751.1 MAG: 30S ribosomal protein S20 [Lentisphaerota bacterium]HJH05481.1 30S ribosomal protein S20 [Victivallis vadensis]